VSEAVHRAPGENPRRRSSPARVGFKIEQKHVLMRAPRRYRRTRPSLVLAMGWISFHLGVRIPTEHCLVDSTSTMCSRALDLLAAQSGRDRAA
jgi:hypothetical protein